MEPIYRETLPTIPNNWDSTKQSGMPAMQRSIHYYHFSDVISAMQKSVRRGMAESYFWFLEAYLTGTITTRTNTWNRALVMAFEDVGPCNPYLPLDILHLFQQGSTLALMLACYLLVGSSKCRINDWTIISLHEPSISPDKHPELGGVQDWMSNLLDSLKRKDVLESVFWTNCLTLTSSKEGIPSFFRCFEMLHVNDTYLIKMKHIANMKNWKGDSKTRLVYSHMINLHCYDVWPIHPHKLFAPTKEVIETLSQYVESFRLNKVQLICVPEYAIDKHTKKRPANTTFYADVDSKRVSKVFDMRRSTKHFWEIGSHLEDRDPAWIELDDWFKEYAKQERIKGGVYV